jgi:hypothetical protein
VACGELAWRPTSRMVEFICRTGRRFTSTSSPSREVLCLSHTESCSTIGAGARSSGREVGGDEPAGPGCVLGHHPVGRAATCSHSTRSSRPSREDVVVGEVVGELRRESALFMSGTMRLLSCEHPRRRLAVGLRR